MEGGADYFNGELCTVRLEGQGGAGCSHSVQVARGVWTGAGVDKLSFSSCLNSVAIASCGSHASLYRLDA